jgi:hypothetical protein
MSKECETCDHKKYPDGGHCYMFREEVPGDFCGQHTLVQLAIRKSRLLGSTVEVLTNGGIGFVSALDATLRVYD